MKTKLVELVSDVELEVAGVRAQGRTGEFEVTVDGTLVHSKKNGNGFVDDDEKYAKIVAEIRKKK